MSRNHLVLGPLCIAAIFATSLASHSILQAQAVRDDPPADVKDEGPGSVTESRSVISSSGALTPAPEVAAEPAAQSQTPSEAQQPAPSTDTSEPSPAHRREAEQQYLKGAKALEDQDVRRAAKYFTRAVELDPRNQRYILANEIALQHLVKLLVEEAEKARLMGRSDVERSKLSEALALDPHNGIATQHLYELAEETRPPLGEVTNENAASDLAAPIKLAPDPARKSFHLREGASELLRQVTAAYGISAVIDDSVVKQIRRLDADDVTYAQAAQMVELVTGTFIVPLDPRRVLVAADNKLNRDRFERLAEETVYLPGLTAAEIVDVGNIARNIFDTPYAMVQQQRGALTVRAPESRILALNTVLTELLDGQSEIELNIKAFQVATTRTRNVGLQLPQQTTFFNLESEVNTLINNNQALVNEIISSGLAKAGDTATIAAILIASGQVTGSILSQPFVLFGGGITETGIVPGPVSANLAFNSSDVRTLDDVNMRILNNQAATFRTGMRYPIITSTSTSTSGSIPGINTAGLSSTLAALGISTAALGALTQSTIPQIQYEDLGLTIKATPRIQLDKEITLNLDVKIEALGGSSIDAIPILNNRQFTAVITVPDGQTAMFVSNLNRQEARAVSGIPGLSELPGFGAAADKTTEFDLSKLVVLVTTHVVRLSHGSAVGKMVLLPVHD